MADLNEYEIQVGQTEDNLKSIAVYPAPEKEDANWKVPYHGGHKFFDTKKSVKKHYERKFKIVKD